MIGRRGVLKAIMGATVASQTISKADAMKLAGIGPMDMPTTGEIASNLPVNGDEEVDLWRLANHFSDEYYASFMDEKNMPYWIATKKSWGAGFKAHLGMREKRQKDMIEQAIHRHENKPKIMKLLGL